MIKISLVRPGPISGFVKKGQLARIVERTVNQNCCFSEEVRCRIIARFRLHIVAVFRAQISGGARWELGGGGRGMGGNWN